VPFIKPSTEEGGRPAFDPQLLISLWIYAYSQWIGSAREVARRCEYDPAFPVADGMGGSELPHACGLPAKNDYWSGGTNALFAVDVFVLPGFSLQRPVYLHPLFGE